MTPQCTDIMLAIAKQRAARNGRVKASTFVLYAEHKQRELDEAQRTIEAQKEQLRIYRSDAMRLIAQEAVREGVKG